jgi:uncharacterized protein (TIGR02588 family)
MRRRVVPVRKRRRDAAGGDREPRAGDGASVPRRLAEWTTLAVSTAVVVGLASYLIYEGVTPHSEFASVLATPQLEQVRRVDHRYVLPVEVNNPGRKTLTHLVLEVRSPTGRVETEITLEYLGRRARQTVYAYLEEDPRTHPVTIEPRMYTLD